MAGQILSKSLQFALLLSACSYSTTRAQTSLELHTRYDQYKEQSITDRRFKHVDIEKIVSKLSAPFAVSKVGSSAEGRAIRMISYGSGPISVLMWSQMHGNEPTATMALMDIIRFLQASDKEFELLRDKISSQLTVHFIPMLNPDGAERFQRRNIHGIDINRDALRLQTQEGRILKRVRDSLDANWGFNLHDQSRFTSTGIKPATISVLAPAYNYEREINETRGDAIELISELFLRISPFIPDQIGRYGDAFEPRAFGDNIQKWGTRTILVESGGYQNDREKQYIRQINFVLLLSAMESIASKSYVGKGHDTYFNIPSNSGGLHDLILRNVSFDGITRDIAFRYQEIENVDHSEYYLRAVISDLGDLSTAVAYQEFDASGFHVEQGKLQPEPLGNMQDYQNAPIDDAFAEGITDFTVLEGFSPFNGTYKARIHSSITEITGQTIGLGENPSIVLKRNGRVEYVLTNGRLWKL